VITKINEGKGYDESQIDTYQCGTILKMAVIISSAVDDEQRALEESERKRKQREEGREAHLELMCVGDGGPFLISSKIALIEPHISFLVTRVSQKNTDKEGREGTW
jgi:hypothetical protein